MISANQNPNGRDQESTSEAINCYEAVGLFGSVFEKIFTDDHEKKQIASQIKTTGRIMMTTEIR